MSAARLSSSRPAVAVSACLAGMAVRYDGGDKRHEGVLAELPERLQLLPVCPEVNAGLPVPRPPVQLVVERGVTRVLGRDDPTLDVTLALRATAAATLHDLLRQHPLCGWIWQSRSPSCGLGSTPRFNAAGTALRPGNGIQAGYVARHYPWLLCVEDDELITAADCARFARACGLLFDVVYQQPQRPLLDFHERHRVIREHLPAPAIAHLERLRQLGRRRLWAGFLARWLWRRGVNQLPSSSSQRA